MHFPIGNGAFMSSSRTEVGAILRKLTIFKDRVSVCMIVSRHQDSNRGPSHGVVFRGGDLWKIDDFERGSERLHDCFEAFF